jgi:hypothetical protein
MRAYMYTIYKYSKKERSFQPIKMVGMKTP